MILKSCEANKWTEVIECRNSVAYLFNSLWRGGLNCLANLFKNGPSLFWNRPKIFIYVFCWFIMLILFHINLPMDYDL